MSFHTFENASELQAKIIGSDAQVRFTELMKSFQELEFRCADMIARQEQLGNLIVNRYHEVWDSAFDAEDEDLSAKASSRMSPTDKKLPFADYRAMVNINHQWMRPELPLSAKRFLEKVQSGERQEMLDLDIEINVVKIQMQSIETEILEFTPDTTRDAVLKLRFITALLLTNDEVERSFVAYLVEDCIDAIECSLRTEISLG